MISLIAAIGKNNEVGKGNALLWNMPADMKHFRETTALHAIVMGRKTFESIGKPLPNRRNVVITRDVNYKKNLPAGAGGIEIVHSLAGALDLFPDPNEEIFIIGGAELYKQTMPIADKLYITHINAEDRNADAFFPEIIPVVWNEVSHEEHEADEKNPIPYTFSVYEKFI
ncbi:dihydrofolate reductase [Candidatus Nomurabacteria bacterium]|nr:dihydrofolate reductase [Candidatus Nomurabacteria bacterium]